MKTPQTVEQQIVSLKCRTEILGLLLALLAIGVLIAIVKFGQIMDSEISLPAIHQGTK